MKKSRLAGLLIRTAVVRNADVGYIFASDPKLEEDEIEHTVFFKWDSGKFAEGSLDFSAVTCCLVSSPEWGIMMVEGPGGYAYTTPKARLVGDIIDEAQPPRSYPRYGGFRCVSEIEGKAYAVGYRGMAYRFDAVSRWARIDEDLPRDFNIEAIHGFDKSDIYAVGRQGEVWRFNGQNWTKCDVPTNAYLTRVKCAGNGVVYVAGHNGILVRGRDQAWEVLDLEGMTDDIWDLEWFGGALYISTLSNVYRLEEDHLEVVDFGDDAPGTCYQLDAAKGVMWSVGENDIMSFDGKKWTRIV